MYQRYIPSLFLSVFLKTLRVANMWLKCTLSKKKINLHLNLEKKHTQTIYQSQMIETKNTQIILFTNHLAEKKHTQTIHESHDWKTVIQTSTSAVLSIVMKFSLNFHPHSYLFDWNLVSSGLVELQVRIEKIYLYGIVHMSRNDIELKTLRYDQ